MAALRSIRGAAGRDGRGRNPHTLEELYVEHSRQVYGFLLARSGSRTLAEELTGDVFVAAANAVAVDDIDRSWLITVARRRLVDHWRRMERRHTKMERLRVLEGPRYSGTDEPDNSEAVAVALEAISDRHRAALALRYLDDHSVSEVAELLELSYHAAESLIARARNAFVAAFNAQGGDE